ncbi:hypothetical protein GCM10010124_13150 [Pilimelia terevasa]|uniref:Thioredoxin domain-containing protein n=1 Tax=Pilimelia terevasa TaxID=53372 RepID=A0A8J3FHP2_9ACTN|nr:hypothetical protein [Pilimelia terevasa]GGK22029.1 hypothetical protein GCM10010124_13150 [Pilimelia terevasa]
MDAVTALWIVTWVAIILLFLALGAIVRQMKLLREIVDQQGYTVTEPDVAFAPELVDGRRRVVVAATATCPRCLVILQCALSVVAEGRERAVVLTPDDAADLPPEVTAELDVVTSAQEWQKISHLPPPQLLLVEADGRVTERLSPPDYDTARQALLTWLPATHDSWK